jgi:hypothetical protein
MLRVTITKLFLDGWLVGMEVTDTFQVSNRPKVKVGDVRTSFTGAMYKVTGVKWE